ncbi:hypothetical protein PAAG_00118 [Paracoccidioides lutzii Pb01]|uniref:Immediate-early protein n=1 Tax=Paracoccidioides lutzii (strain ATCC MYA-826 / Pb01) TaxID=502779 RepID=C1GNM3_PARBA|nr:hypothetical protein PAAG_00118 [Paracoccidioides lutzii Pb01]EEH35795.1 hypothetical protein PAAG_00118 [Paracoccidioides lutzii Pb01]
MLSHIVTAARGIFTRHDPGAEPAISPSPNPTDMVSATRHTALHSTTATTPVEALYSSPATNGKRKSASAREETESQAPKRKKKSRASEVISSATIEVVDDDVETSVKNLPYRTVDSNDTVGPDMHSEEEKRDHTADQVKEPYNGMTNSAARSTHVRFGSEEPSLETNGGHEPAVEEETSTGVRETEDSDDDDEAPETIDNAVQLRKLKEAARKEAQSKQRTKALHKEKRRERDQQLKAQAQAQAQAVARPAPPKSNHETSSLDPKHEEILSESSATLQGSTSKFIHPLPILLPDEILNAEPSSAHNIPTPPYESNSTSATRMPKKYKFLDKVEKRPRDIKIGGAVIRVLESSGGGFGGVSLPPKASKNSRRVKDNWMAGNRRLPSGGSLRRRSGVASFVRK